MPYDHLFSGVRVTGNGQFGPGSGPIFLEQVNCDGNEDRILDCSASYGLHSCTHADDVAVVCEGT